MRNLPTRLVAALFCVCAACAPTFGADDGPDFSAIDRQVSAAPQSAGGSVKSLAAYFATFCKTDTEKARAIFDWIVGNIDYDWKAAITNDFSGQSPEKVLKNRKAVCGGYAYLFGALADALKLKQTTIPGCSKGLNYAIGQKQPRSNHAWNAVCLNGEWKLIDCAWGSGYIDSQGKFVRRRSEHYFLTPPDRFIYNHFPDDPKWQLLAKPVTREEYENMVLVRPEFFSYDLSLISHPCASIKSGATVEVTLGAPADVLMIADVLPPSGKSDEKISGASTFVQRSGSQLHVSASFPSAGTYLLRLYARHKGDRTACQCVADYSVEASSGTEGKAGLPNAYPAFQERNAHLDAPMKGVLVSGTMETFQITVPGADDVGVVVDGKLTKLEKNGDQFQGEARISGDKVSVAAKFPGREDYSVLIEYQVSGETASSDR